MFLERKWRKSPKQNDFKKRNLQRKRAAKYNRIRVGNGRERVIVLLTFMRGLYI